jgi:hypothetical protein
MQDASESDGYDIERHKNLRKLTGGEEEVQRRISSE